MALDYAGHELITPWWIDRYGDHFFWYCPTRWGRVHDDIVRGYEIFDQVDGHGLNPNAEDLCPWCTAHYNATRPLTEQDRIYLFTEESPWPVAEYVIPDNSRDSVEA